MLGEVSWIKSTWTKLLQVAAFTISLLLLVGLGVFGLGILNEQLTLHDSSHISTVAMGGSWILLAVMLNIKRKSQPDSSLKVELVIFYILLIIQSAYVASFASIFIFAWIFLLAITYMLCGKRGYLTGLLALALAFSIESLLALRLEINKILALFLTFLLALTVSLLIVRLYTEVERKLKEQLKDIEAGQVNESRLNTIINSLTDAVFGIDKNGVVSTYNASAVNLVDTNEDICGENINDLISLTDTKKREINVVDELIKTDSTRVRDDIVMAIDDNDKLRLEATFAPIFSGESLNPDNYMLILRDITNSKTLEEEKDEFIGVVSHELRTPITIAEGSLSNIKLMLKNNATNKIDESIKQAHDQVVFLSKLVNDLSTLSRAERGAQEEPETIDIKELAAQLHQEYSKHASKKHLMLNLDLRPGIDEIYTSRLYLQELLQNLLTNAIKYTQEGSITLQVKKDGEYTYFGVIDTGIGLGKSDLAKIFNKFYRAEDYRTRETTGTGLGLYVAKRLADRLGSKIDVRSRLNHGSTFSFRIKDLD